MKMIPYNVLIFLIVFIANPIFSLNNKGEECQQEGPCTCIYSNGLEINLKNITKDSYISSSGSNYSMYFYSPCQNIAINLSKSEGKSALWVFVQNGSSPLDPGKVIAGNVSGTFTPIGKSDNAKFELTQLYSNKAIVEYDLLGSKSKVELDCTEGKSIQFFIGPDSSGSAFAHSLILRGDAACPKLMTPENHNLSTGSVLVIMFLTAVLIYLLGGMLILKCLRGAEGLEMIPNIDFWLWFIALVKDGINFAMTCRRPSDSYERI